MKGHERLMEKAFTPSRNFAVCCMSFCISKSNWQDQWWPPIIRLSFIIYLFPSFIWNHYKSVLFFGDKNTTCIRVVHIHSSLCKYGHEIDTFPVIWFVVITRECNPFAPPCLSCCVRSYFLLSTELNWIELFFREMHYFRRHAHRCISYHSNY